VSTTLKRVYGYLAEFDSVQDLYHAAEQVRDAGYKRWDVHSPFPIHGMDGAMGNPRSILPKFVFFGGITGTTIAFILRPSHRRISGSSIGLILQTSSTYPTVVQAKPTDIWTLPRSSR
jgi:hypothetical protein